MNGILFLCVANSARSQMAEGFARVLAPEGVQVFSAGSAPTYPNPHAVAVMEEVEIDISGHTSKHADSLSSARIDVVITLCAEEYCPAYLREARRLHWPFNDPGMGDDMDEIRASFRRVRDQIHHRLRVFFSDEWAELVAGRTSG